MTASPPWSARLDRERRLVVSTLAGPVHATDVTEMVAHARELAAREGYDLLYDLSAATLGDISHGDVFWMSRTIPALKDMQLRRQRVALVYPPANEPFAHFWETAFSNSGIVARAFPDQASALDWLAAR